MLGKPYGGPNLRHVLLQQPFGVWFGGVHPGRVLFAGDVLRPRFHWEAW